jgi:hypothetical protein
MAINELDTSGLIVPASKASKEKKFLPTNAKES